MLLPFAGTVYQAYSCCDVGLQTRKNELMYFSTWKGSLVIYLLNYLNIVYIDMVHVCYVTWRKEKDADKALGMKLWLHSWL